jgi:L-ascorbate metabolism protein UlaG (beta-lactamase superfamily)
MLAAPASGAVTVRWLGVAGFSIQAGGTTLLFDPYLSRPSLWRTLLWRYRPDTERLARLTGPGSPAPELASAELLLIGHSHFDHLGDAPWLAGRSGALLVGSETTVAIARGYGLPEARTRRADPGARLREGPFEIRVVESRHAPVLFGRVPLEGEVRTPPKAPIHALSFVLGDARGYLVTHRPTGLRVYVLSSADRHLPALEALREEGVEVDLLLPAMRGRDAGFARDLVRTLRPHRIVPHHFDDFFRGLDDPDAAAPADPEDLAAFESELRAAGEAAGVALEVRRLGLFETLTLAVPR